MLVSSTEKSQSSSYSRITRSIAALVIACFGSSTLFAAGTHLSSSQRMIVPIESEVSDDLTLQPQEIAAIEEAMKALSTIERQELLGIYDASDKMEQVENSLATDQTRDHAKSWKTWLVKTILKSPAFRAALQRIAPSNVYVWWTNYGVRVTNAIDGIDNATVAGIAAALVAVGVPPTYARYIAKAVSFFL